MPQGDTFPNGHALLHTPSTGLRCGFYALLKSMQAQHPGIPPPTMEELDEIFGSDRVVSQNREFGLTNTNEFSVGQLALVIGLWGEARGLNIQLGILRDGRGGYFVPADFEGQLVRLWIHNDDAEARGIARISHFSGVGPAQAGNVANAQMLAGTTDGGSPGELGRTGLVSMSEIKVPTLPTVSNHRSASTNRKRPLNAESLNGELDRASDGGFKSRRGKRRFAGDKRLTNRTPAQTSPQLNQTPDVDSDASWVPSEAGSRYSTPDGARDGGSDSVTGERSDDTTDGKPKSAVNGGDELEAARLRGWLGISAEQAATLMIERKLLGARYSKDRIADEPFVKIVTPVVAGIRGDTSENIRLALDASTDREWALAIEQSTPRIVRQLVTQPSAPTPDEFRLLPPVDSNDFGVYACLLVAKSSAHHHHMYVGSATGRGGLKRRVADHLQPPSNKPQERRSLFYNLKKDKSRETVWAKLFEIQGSGDEDDTIARTANRLLALLTETVFMDILASWTNPPNYRPPPWSSGIQWMGTNSAFPLDGARGVVAAFSIDVTKARNAKRGMDRWNALSPSEKKRIHRKGNERARRKHGWTVRRTPWTAEEDALLTHLRGLNRSVKHIHRLFSEKFPGRTPSALNTRYKTLGLTVEASNWSPEEDALLVKLRGEDRLPWKMVTQRFRECFPNRSENTLPQRWQKIGGSMRGQDSRLFSEEEAAHILQKKADPTVTWADILREWPKEFPRRTISSLATYYCKIRVKK